MLPSGHRLFGIMSGGPQRFGSHSTLGLLEVGLLDPEPASIAGAVVVGIGSLGGVGAFVGGGELVWGLQAANASTNINDILPDLTSGIVVQLDCSVSENFPERDSIEKQ